MEAQWPIGYGVGLRIKRSSVRIRPWPLRWVLGQGSLLPLSQEDAFTLASISYLAILVKYILAKKKMFLCFRPILQFCKIEKNEVGHFRWCIRLTRLTLVCEVIRYRLVQVRQNLKKNKIFRKIKLAWKVMRGVWMVSPHCTQLFRSFSIQRRTQGAVAGLSF